jgi:two-component system response regulator (stage 0 sporulation protein F)
MYWQRAFDIVFIDMKLPVLNGLEVLKAIRQIGPQAVDVVMTAYHQEMASLVDEALRNEAYTGLHKPLEIEELLTVVEDIESRKLGGAQYT